MTFTQQLFNWSAIGLAGYVILLVSLCFPGPQRAIVYLNWVVWPPGANFSEPEQFGYSPGAARQINLITETKLRLGAWHVLPDSVHKQLMETSTNNDTLLDSVYDNALKTHETVLYLHGNAATRGFHRRVDVCKRIASGMNANVFVVDYRGFADSGEEIATLTFGCKLANCCTDNIAESDGTPSEEGLIEDATLSWRWLIDHGASPANITILGHSLGTGVASQLTARLTKEGTSPKALVLKAPFSSIPELVFEFRILQFIPLFWPLSYIPNGLGWMWTILDTHFDSFEAIKHITCPILFLHGGRDLQIPSTHARRLFWSAVVNRARAQSTGPRIPTLIDETPVPTDTAGNIVKQDLATPRDVESLAKDVEVSKEIWSDEGYRWQTAELGVTYVELSIAHHDNLHEFERMWQSIQELS
ncbi:Alpha/Beta hydrolase protein [Syncephalis plumigaleata]|nr:Alpha/Beta hydrolase protein [Syncephalis plumigaleata]